MFRFIICVVHISPCHQHKLCNRRKHVNTTIKWGKHVRRKNEKNLSKNINTWERAGTYIHTYMYTETYRRLWSSTQAGKQ